VPPLASELARSSYPLRTRTDRLIVVAATSCRQTAAVRIKVLDPGLVSDLAAFLRAADFAVTETDSTEITVESPHGNNAAETRGDLSFRIATWCAMHEGTTAELLD